MLLKASIDDGGGMVVVTERGRWREKKEETSMSVPVVSRMPYTRVDVPAYLAWSNASSQAQPADQPTDPPQIGSCIYHSLSSAAAAQAKYVSSPSAPPSSSSFAAAPAPPRPMSETAHLSKWSPRPLRLAQVYCYRADMTLYCCSRTSGDRAAAKHHVRPTAVSLRRPQKQLRLLQVMDSLRHRARQRRRSSKEGRRGRRGWGGYILRLRSSSG